MRSKGDRMRAVDVRWGQGGGAERARSDLPQIPRAYAFVKINQTVPLRPVHSTVI